MNKTTEGTMNQQGALDVLISVAEEACRKGVFSLKNAKVVAEAVEVLQTPTRPETPETTEVPKKK